MQRTPHNQREKTIPTISSRPHTHPHELPWEVTDLILAYRKHYERDAFFIHHLLTNADVNVSLSSVKRTLKRNQLTYLNLWKKWRVYPRRDQSPRNQVYWSRSTLSMLRLPATSCTYIPLLMFARDGRIPSHRFTSTHIEASPLLNTKPCYLEKRTSRIPALLQPEKTAHGDQYENADRNGAKLLNFIRNSLIWQKTLFFSLSQLKIFLQ